MKRALDSDDTLDVKVDVNEQQQQQQEGQVDLESRGLEEVPLELIGPASSEVLSISLKRNRISRIGTELYAFTSLRKLDLSRNKIHTISPGISALVNLEQLVLLSNKLKLSTIPVDELVAMPSLVLIDLRCECGLIVACRRGYLD